MGKVPYVAPEIFHGMADELSDVYSLGVTLTEAAIGRGSFPRRRFTSRWRLASKRMSTRSWSMRVAISRRASPSCLPGSQATTETIVQVPTKRSRDFEQMAGSTTSTAEHQLAELVKMTKDP